ncbi:hypothetical protein BJY52DRAFT_1355855 [Lactarius psammicola]|nr:hypothetical protein BJY52DRAFT_1355855 [Lactarius psammicola]
MLTLVALLVASNLILFWLKGWFPFPVLGSEAKPTLTSTSQYQSPSSIDSSLRTFYTADSSPSHSSACQQSRTNVLYPSRVHPPPISVFPDSIIALDIPIWDVEYLCTDLLPATEIRLMPAGRVLLRALGLKGDSPQRASKWTDEEFRYCSRLFIVLTREILLKDVAGAKELEGPCNLLHE